MVEAGARKLWMNKMVIKVGEMIKTKDRKVRLGEELTRDLSLLKQEKKTKAGAALILLQEIMKETKATETPKQETLEETVDGELLPKVQLMKVVGEEEKVLVEEIMEEEILGGQEMTRNLNQEVEVRVGEKARSLHRLSLVVGVLEQVQLEMEEERVLQEEEEDKANQSLLRATRLGANVLMMMMSQEAGVTNF